MITEPLTLADRYVAMWNEPDAPARDAMVRALWAADARHVLEPPAEMRAQAAQIGFTNPALVAHGHEELCARVRRAHEEFVAPGEFAFQLAGAAHRLADLVCFDWEMVRLATGEVAATGSEVLLLTPDERIRADYQLNVR
jgi:hypothetical protein